METIVVQNIILSFAAFASALVITCFAINLVIRLSRHLELFDPPNERKLHTGKISRLGGIGIFTGFIISIGLTPILIGLWLSTPFAVYGKILPKIHFIIATILIFSIGLMDDFLDVKARWKLIIQIIAAVIVLVGGAQIDTIALPFTDIKMHMGWLTWPITLLWIIGVTNAINLIDGMDGLSASIGTVSFGVYGIVFLLGNHFILAIISFVLMGTLVGYLMFNYPPARIFMGDSGSLVIGFLLAVLPLVAGSADGTIIYMPITMLLIPIVDVFIAIVRRRRKKISFTSPDREHIHHKLLELGFRERGVLTMITSILTISSIPVVLLTSVSFNQVAPFLLLIWVLIGTGFGILNFLYGKQIKQNEK